MNGDLQTTSKACQLNNRRGLIYQAGFAVERKFVGLYEMCYDSQSASALYSHHQINGKAIKCKLSDFFESSSSLAVSWLINSLHSSFIVNYSIVL